MRILILANFDLGLYRFRKELIEELINKNNQVYISLPDGDLVRPLENMGCIFIETPVDRRGINPITDFKLLQRYRRIIKKVNPELVVTYTIKPNIYGGIAAKLAKKQYAVNITGLGTAFERSGMLKLIVVGLYKYALKKVKVVFVENSEIGKQLKDLKLCSPNRIVVLNGAGVNTKTFVYEEYPDNDKMQFLFIGRVMKEKGIDELLNSMKRLVDEGFSCLLDVVGPLEEDYKEKFEISEKEGWFKYHGFQEDVRPYIKNCDCFILPSYHEGMANTNLECASCGRPVITSNIPGCKEAVIEGITGFLCEVKNCDSLYRAMKKMLELSKEERMQMGCYGRKHMQDVFEKKRIVKKTVAAML